MTVNSRGTKKHDRKYFIFGQQSPFTYFQRRKRTSNIINKNKAMCQSIFCISSSFFSLKQFTVKKHFLNKTHISDTVKKRQENQPLNAAHDASLIPA